MMIQKSKQSNLETLSGNSTQVWLPTEPSPEQDDIHKVSPSKLKIVDVGHSTRVKAILMGRKSAAWRCPPRRESPLRFHISQRITASLQLSSDNVDLFIHSLPWCLVFEAERPAYYMLEMREVAKCNA